MEKFCFIIIIICLIVWLTCCFPHREKGENNRIVKKGTGEVTAADNLIQKYEKEHWKFYAIETQYGPCLEWPALNGKNLSNYCTNYLQDTVPNRKTDSIIGIKIRITLSYREQYTNINNIIVIAIQCKVMKKNNKFSYYITRAPEKNCVYSLERTRNKRVFIFTIINEHCDFENNISRHLKQKSVEFISQMNRETGQPIAKHEYLLQYELEHQKMLEKEGCKGTYIDWPHAMAHPNLNYYCYQYMEKCVPNRHREGVTGNWKRKKLQYQNLHILKIVEVTIVTCVPPKPSKRRYYITRALEPNCVHALLLQQYNVPSYALGHYVIVFKHCDFEYVDDQKNTFHYDIPDKNIYPKTEVKEEQLDMLEPLQLFPQD